MSFAGFTILSLASVLFYRIFIYNVFISPLSGIPSAHWSARFSPLWILWTRYHKRENRTVHAAHQRLGPIVRLGPSEIAVNDLQGIKTVYSGGWEKSEWYSLFTNFNGVRNMFSMLDNYHHSQRKRQLSNIYSKSYLQRAPIMVTILENVIKKSFLNIIQDAATKGKGLEVNNILSRMAMDAISGYIFGVRNGTRMLEHPHTFNDFIKVYVERSKHSFIVQELPQILPVARMLALPPYTKQVAHARAMVDKFCFDLCKATATKAEHDDVNPSESPVYTQLRKYDQAEDELKPSGARHEASKVVASELLDHLLAGFETTAIALTYAFYQLSQHTKVQNELRCELRSLKRPFLKSGNSAIPSSIEIDALPLLHAIIMETLRLNPSIPGPQPRVSPEGAFLHGYGPLPADVRVSAQAYALHRNEDVFPDPELWDPHRWIANDCAQDMNRLHWAFSSGGRMCIGSHFALLESKMALAAVYTNFETYVVDASGIDQQDTYTAGPIGEVWIGFNLATE